MAFKQSPLPPPQARQRLSLGRSRRRLKYEQRVRVWLTVMVLPTVLCTALFAYREGASLFVAAVATLAVAVFWTILASFFFEQLVRPLQTLSNVVAALREDDFSFRARGARRGDALGDLALEVNALAGTLQSQRSAARDALTLVERVIHSMQSPVIAYDGEGRLRLINPAAERSFELKRQSALGKSLVELNLTDMLHAEDEGLYAGPGSPNHTPLGRWSIRRTTFRLQGVPHSLLVLSDVTAALREEERLAWQRLIRVLSHEINNSLTPIKSIAGSLRTRLPAESSSASVNEDLYRGLTVIEERSASLNRFLQAYQQLSHLPRPQLRPVALGQLLEHIVQLETKLRVEVCAGPPVRLLIDLDQIQQLLINLIRNAVEAALSAVEAGTLDIREMQVVVSWTLSPSQTIIVIRDNGPGLMNPSNLFVPFYTTKPHGSGIGLVLAQQIASAHKGSIALFNNEDGAGCTAELRLPLNQ